MATNSVPETLAFGLTISQLEQLRLQARTATSVLDIFTTNGLDDISPDSVRMLGGMAFQAAYAVRDAVDAISAQHLDQHPGHLGHDDERAMHAAPSWEAAPAWANFLAMDADGKWCWYENRPYQDNHASDQDYGMWDTEEGRRQAAITVHGWQDSLQQKPAAMEAVPAVPRAAA
ncbi:hypothetical protein [Xanthomonas sp. CFBP 8445]|uniref:hypothetical protein n=1 Tax=Xanthomonas sp. CFBP 8445 TaxID=2971236 RepID=UPI0021E0646F|nr:hypothetical protein [Xanthomonas sp. CFBP 8445]UYC12857.1 hypothetical protein NUG21_03675 [Xanthomonas sp. CFBP 8445]